ncbi:MAG: rhodanese-like domain-containing protein [Thermodesulfobacteriota bacterium]
MLRRLLIFLFAGLLLLPSLAGAAEKSVGVQTISVLEAAQMLAGEPKSTFLVDVRTRLEYGLLGHPPKAYNIPWRFATLDFQVQGGRYDGGKALFTGYQLSAKPNPNFVGVAKSLFKPDDKLLILSTDGVLGAEAADALFQAGFKQVFNLQHGFLGPKLNSDKQHELAEKYSPHFGSRGRVNGWVYWGLPVTFNIDPRYVYPPDLKRMQDMK